MEQADCTRRLFAEKSFWHSAQIRSVIVFSVTGVVLKLQRMLRALNSVLLFAFIAVTPAFAAPPVTRASQLRGMAVGMGKLLHIADYLRDYPGSRTAILSYFKMDSMDAGALIRDLRVQASIEAEAHRDFTPQIALETEHLSLPAFTRELSRSGSPLDRNARLLASEIARYRDQNKWFFIRPFSEMNDATLNTPWEFGNRKYHNTPADLAAAWMLLRRVFDEEGATNALFIFSPLAANGVHRQDEVLDALNRIPLGRY